jgi:NADPH:quinone reductase-like Zn-dependent oxidoreductase
LAHAKAIRIIFHGIPGNKTGIKPKGVVQMKAIVCSKYGDPDSLELKELERPVPKDDEVLVRIFASSVNTQNLLYVTGKPSLVRLGTGIWKPKFQIPGNDVSGRVEAIGRSVNQFAPGNLIFVDVSGFGFGAYAEYACFPKTALVLKPENATFEQAAGAGEAALVALQALRDKGGIQKGKRVLIYGASGGIGSFAVQFARYYQADVTGVCSTVNLDMVRSLGADHVIDYTKENYPMSGKRYDLIFAIAYRSIFDHIQALSAEGIYVSTGGPSLKRIFQDIPLGRLLSRKGGKSVKGGWTVSPNPKDLEFIKELIEGGKIKPVIDRQYPLRETAEALKYYARGRTRGKVIITME